MSFKNLDNGYYALIEVNTDWGVGGHIIKWGDTREHTIDEILFYFSASIMGLEDSYDPEYDDEKLFPKFKRNFRKINYNSRDSTIRKLGFEIGSVTDKIIIFGKGKKVLIEILKYIEGNSKFYCPNDIEEDSDFYDPDEINIKLIIPKISKDDITLFDYLEKLNEIIWCG